MRRSRADIKYTCWVPSSGLSSPAVTIISQFQLSNATQASFVTNNRLAWAAAQRYRYCELGVRPDHFRQSWAWARIPLLLATLRCSDYVVHLDADAFVMRPEWGVESYLRQMQERRASLLVTRDYLDLKRSPINFGVHIARATDWTLRFFSEIYNMCACDSAKLLNWPAEQGLLVEWLQARGHDPLAGGGPIIVIDNAGLNRFHYPSWDHKQGESAVPAQAHIVHYACCVPARPPTGGKRNSRHGFDRSFDARINAAIGDFARIHAANLSAAGGVRVMLQPPSRSTAEGGAAAPPAHLPWGGAMQLASSRWPCAAVGRREVGSVRHGGYLRGVGTHLGSLLHTEESADEEDAKAAAELDEPARHRGARGLLRRRLDALRRVAVISTVCPAAAVGKCRVVGPAPPDR
mmetsp:Transcript_45004/g.146193  ORF Transcript_45004/g.146193 Transcript_45004/m.146193 type:complete len:406 (-) Transcript_45004:135-1352(-)|eukprot:CAMPEP_0185289520 /NCGR_PEP_ID=MMETSP1363-20130426/3955_1 /TAXON_ID=38817 /ORGANISM="Gephyrocapsa oceanica, Strain RCC1303" /LENGTH=405 /DNA_ID=CAMNT_0027885413 /DNA_START=96 /DNA_END=1313 /DNA_ORIENTATION=+